MSRGNRPTPGERTPEERELARQARERRRAEQAGGTEAPGDTAPAERLVEEEEIEPGVEAPPEPQPLALEPEAHEIPPPAQPGYEPPPVESDSQPVPAPEEPAFGDAVAHEPAAMAPAGEAPAEPASLEPTAAPESEPVSAEPPPEAESPSEPAWPAADPESAWPAPEPGAALPEPGAALPEPGAALAEPEPAWPVSEPEPALPVSESAPEPEPARPAHEAEPGLPAHEPEPASEPALPVPEPESAQQTPGQSPGQRAPLPPPRRPALSNAALGLAPAQGRGHRHHAPRSLPARLGAVLALLVVAAAIVLLVRALAHSPHTSTPVAPKVTKVLVPEGKTRAQIAQIAQSAGLVGSYRVASRSSPLLDPRRYGAPAATHTLEGFLFPATYDLDPGQAVTRLVREQLIAFRENVGASILARARALHETVYELLTVASMVEREAQVPADRAKVAAVIYNRLSRGMPLGIDATIYYAVEQRSGIATYTKELTESQLHLDSPYNTRTHTGLPPTPISNPGLASIEAAAHPAHAPYLYYVAGADGCGEQVFSTTQAAFEANVAAYDAAVRKNGGKPPACKHSK